MGVPLLGYVGFDTGISVLASNELGICEGIAPGQGPDDSGIQFNVTFCGTNSSSGISGGAVTGATGA